MSARVRGTGAGGGGGDRASGLGAAIDRFRASAATDLDLADGPTLGSSAARPGKDAP